MRIRGLDHVVLTVADPEASVTFYERPIRSLYFRDPDGSLIEISEEL